MAVWYSIIWTDRNSCNESFSDGYLDFQSSAIFEQCCKNSFLLLRIFEHIFRVQNAVYRELLTSEIITSGPGQSYLVWDRPWPPERPVG